jgi:hypothetical protein
MPTAADEKLKMAEKHVSWAGCMRYYQWLSLVSMNSVPMITMDIKRIWAMELTRDHIKELRDSIFLIRQLVVGANRDMARFLGKN